jgi:hypothetical protein|tara:strand:+ start:216 stop:422 length:207 start_codon:yes stop_codon:yes gene_type:complete
MKLMEKPTNTYEVIVNKTIAVTYLVKSKSANEALDKSLDPWEVKGVKEIKSQTLQKDIVSIECIKKDI